jgi:hypothetical protein
MGSSVMSAKFKSGIRLMSRTKEAFMRTPLSAAALLTMMLVNFSTFGMGQEVVKG